ncbi:hypothetical protein EW146_g6793 [Bondarzewia mesenterica]|uniref:Uncharacterized protein n=1 Tax=Bondarzewia mesenterica TaxID=1095465 RepID=A0A4V3XEF7_9AGAM|nr:hypothetical protein EW146_g6793 [Bondarzewia mesenterica]
MLPQAPASPGHPTPPPSSPRGFYQAYIEDAPDDGLEPAQPRACRIQHPMLDGVPVDEQGNDLPPGALPAPYANNTDVVNWAPFSNRAQFELADFLFRQNQMLAMNIDTLLNLWAASQHEGEEPPFMSHTDVYSHINSIRHGDFRNPRMLIRNQLDNLDYADEIDYAPVQVFDADGQHVWSDFMMANWAWCQANKVAKDLTTHEVMFVPIILGSDKTTVSVATGQNEYYPLYISNGNIHNNVRCTHRNGVSLAGFLSIPKTDRAFPDDAVFRSFHRQLYHLSLTQILEPLRPGMTTPEVIQCPDGHLRRVIYGLGPYIAHYPEQVMLACIVLGWCPRCTAHHDNLDGSGISHSHGLTRLLMDAYDDKELWDNHGIIPDVMGTFKDHLVAWVEQYLKIVHPAGVATAIMADIDRCTIASFMDFCYLVRCSTINKSTLTQIEDALRRFHADRAIFEETGIHPTGFSLPRQHALIHYCCLVQDFGAPNAACWVDFEARGMLAGPCLSQSVQAAIVAERAITDANCNGTGTGPTHPIAQANALNVDAANGPHVQATITLQGRERVDIHGAMIVGSEANIDECPRFDASSKISVFHSAQALFYSPSDLCGVGGMHRECIRAVPAWHGEGSQNDCIFAEKDAELPGMQGLHVA